MEKEGGSCSVSSSSDNRYVKNVSLSLDVTELSEFESPVLEACGCLGGLLSALGAVGMLVFMVLYIDNSQILA